MSRSKSAEETAPPDCWYTEQPAALPVDLLTKLYSAELPETAARLLARWHRLRYRMGLPIRPQFAFRPTARLLVETESRAPPPARNAWASEKEQLRDAGFATLGAVRRRIIGNRREAVLLLSGDDGTVMAAVTWRETDSERQKSLSLWSSEPDGTDTVTAALPRRQRLMNSMPGPSFVCIRYSAARTTPARLIEIHRQRTRDLPVLRLSDDELAERYRFHCSRMLAHDLESGIVRPCSDKEIRRLLGG